MNDDPLILYCLARADLSSMGRGKGYAQACHVGSLFSEHAMVRPLLKGDSIDPEVNLWRQGDQEGEPLGFGITLSIDVPDLKSLETVTDVAKSLGFHASPLVDPTYPYWVPAEILPRLDATKFTAPPHPVGDGMVACYTREVTMGYVFGRKSQLSVLLSRFKLVPNE